MQDQEFDPLSRLTPYIAIWWAIVYKGGTLEDIRQGLAKGIEGVGIVEDQELGYREDVRKVLRKPVMFMKLTPEEVRKEVLHLMRRGYVAPDAYLFRGWFLHRPFHATAKGRDAFEEYKRNYLQFQEFLKLERHKLEMVFQLLRTK